MSLKKVYVKFTIGEVYVNVTMCPLKASSDIDSKSCKVEAPTGGVL